MASKSDLEYLDLQSHRPVWIYSQTIQRYIHFAEPIHINGGVGQISEARKFRLRAQADAAFVYCRAKNQAKMQTIVLEKI